MPKNKKKTQNQNNGYKYLTFILAIVLVALVACLSYNMVYKAGILTSHANATSSTEASTTTSTTSTFHTTSTLSSISISTTSTLPTTTILTTSSSTSSSTTLSTTSSAITTSSSTSSSSSAATTVQSQNQTNQSASVIIIPNPNEKGTRFVYVPIQTSNATTIDFICSYFPVGYQNPGFMNGTYGSNFSSIYTLQGQLQISNLGQSLNVPNATYESYNYGVMCN